MKISSKSILSPCRGRDAPMSLSTSLSRRLKTNASLKGGQSPMFPTGVKKRSCAFENPGEPSSPKVTCIGQVRVKTKKQGKRMRTLSKSREGVNPNQTQNQECLPHRNQRWVHLPLTICEALRGFGAEFSCCFSTSGRGKEEKATGSSEGNGRSSFGRWLVVGEEEEEKTETRERILRRHVDVVEKIEIKDEKWEVKECVVEEEEDEEEARVSICIPPKNALLLMRCRSDPMRMSALTNRLWELPAAPEGEEEDDDDHEEVEISENLASTEANEEEQENTEAEVHYIVMEVQEDEERENPEDKLEIINDEVQEEEEEEEKQEPVVQVVNLAIEPEKNYQVSYSLSEALADQEELENEGERKASHHSSSAMYVHSGSEDEGEVAEKKSTEEKESQERPLKEEEETETQERSESEERERESHARIETESEVKKKKKPERRSSSTALPDCLLLMMREPKLSMEVSEETWVCSTDFIRWLPERPVNNKDGGDDPKKRISIDSDPTLPAENAACHQSQQQPGRLSCSFPAPAAVSMAAMIEQKLAFEPFVLTRCNSEPRRTAAAKLAPESCFWKNRKLEPHRRATFGVGAAGVGF